MESPTPPPTPSSRTTAANVLLIVTTLLLGIVSSVHMFFVAPTYRKLLADLNVTPSTPTRLAFNISRIGALLFFVALAGLVWAYMRERKGRTGAFNLTLAIATLAAAVYLCLVSSVYLDVARVLPNFH